MFEFFFACLFPLGLVVVGLCFAKFGRGSRRRGRLSTSRRKLSPFIPFRSVSPAEKNQRDLDRYLTGPLEPWEIGRAYERQVGFVLESLGYDVTFSGAILGQQDLGRDLIAKKGRETLIVQTKYWAKGKVIYPKHVFQLIGTTLYYRETHPGSEATAVFFTTATFSDEAEKVAIALGVRLEILEFTKNYPLIKCNVRESGEKIYHLPCDEFYDRVKIKPIHDEFYAKTIEEAEAAGFRRAKRYYKKTG